MRSNRPKHPEEIELEGKEAELRQLRELHTSRLDSLAKLRSELRIFERVYHQIIGLRVAELDSLEAQICGVTDEQWDRDDELHAPSKGEWSGHLHSADLIDDTTPPEKPAQKALKAIYREVAKAIHPDLAKNDTDRARREKLMSLANLAYAEGNREALQEILRGIKQTGEKVRCGNIGEELIRLIRLIALERERIHEVDNQIESLKATDTYIFKRRVDDSAGSGIDLLAEMAATIDLNIANARKRLSAMKGKPVPLEPVSPSQQTRVIRFPIGLSCGVLYTRKRDSINYCDWQKLSIAKGARAVPLNLAVRLDVRGDLTPDLRFLQELQSDDLQSLFMYEVTDVSFGYIRHLTGLEELYLSDSRISDASFVNLSYLPNLSRIYLYHTDISDAGLIPLYALKNLSQFTCSGTMISEAGLARLQKAVPGVRTLSFPWRYGKK